MRWSAGLLLAILAQAKATAVSVPNGSEVERFARKQPLQFRGGSVEASPKVFRRLGDDTRMPSLFLPSESLYDRYAACLAATEGLRRIRDRDLSDEMRENGYIRRGLTGEESEQERKIKAQYIQNSSKVLRALGMSVGQFNELGKQISQNEGLKEKIMEQAYLYRMAATISMDRLPLIDDPKSQRLQDYKKDKVQLFCESLSEIEQLQESQIDRLKRALRVDRFPNVNISDPGLLPFLSPKVRAVVEAFPLQAEDIVKKHGLDSEEFNKMLEETKSNPLFRWKIQKQLRTDTPHQDEPPHSRTTEMIDLPDSFGRSRISP